MAKETAGREHPFDLEERLIAFAGRVVEAVSALPKTQVEADHPETKPDF